MAYYSLMRLPQFSGEARKSASLQACLSRIRVNELFCRREDRPFFDCVTYEKSIDVGKVDVRLRSACRLSRGERQSPKRQENKKPKIGRSGLNSLLIEV
jgi:hypothetical protein